MLEDFLIFLPKTILSLKCFISMKKQNIEEQVKINNEKVWIKYLYDRKLICQTHKLFVNKLFQKQCGGPSELSNATNVLVLSSVFVC